MQQMVFDIKIELCKIPAGSCFQVRFPVSLNLEPEAMPAINLIFHGAASGAHSPKPSIGRLTLAGTEPKGEENAAILFIFMDI